MGNNTGNSTFGASIVELATLVLYICNTSIGSKNYIVNSVTKVAKPNPLSSTG